ncbi:helix-turn-helix domain-containing protein [Occultella gossypii]|uniref:Helix-turn-helix domain-containing protein n=1 Tax=Occultella gossypii TaxID=2800820 RepID=A0ABS7S6S5_9MICO|nr:helix-turn-helix domain-containing protein [Occultella gossypii]MBZ2196056.1 helix-turn-helix domain-containing protein [Occultella gossypii]
MTLQDSAARPESHTPIVRRVVAGEFDEDPRYATYRERGTTDWLLVHTLEGAGRFGARSTDVPAVPGRTLLVRPGTLHDYGTAVGQERWHFLYAHFHPRDDWLPLLSWPQAAAGIGAIEATGEVRRGIEVALRAAVGGRGTAGRNGELAAVNALESALLWCDRVNLSRELAGTDERLLRAVALIDADLRAALRVANLARASSLSPSRFAHLFVSQFGVSPQRFVERRRLAEAARSLELTSRTVTSIAASCGFESPMYFASRFRARYGMSPSEFRGRREL